MLTPKEEIRLKMVELIAKTTPSDLISANRIIEDAEKLSNYVINGSTKNKNHAPLQSSNTDSKAQDNNHVDAIVVFGFHPQQKQS